jgi:hypothetical protein
MPVELPLKPRHLHPQAKKMKSSSSTSGSGGSKKANNGMAAVARAQAQKAAREQTKRNQKVMLVLPNGKVRFVRASDLIKPGPVAVKI